MSSRTWHDVWTDRDDDRADWNGHEANFSTFDEYLAFVEAQAAFVIDTLGIGPDDRVVDLGCGTGLIAARVASVAHSVVGIDYSATVIRVAAERRRAENVVFREGDLTDMDMVRELLDSATCVYAVGSLLYLPHLKDVLGLLDLAVESGVKLLAIDIPDAGRPDERPRHYDTSSFRHLAISPEELLERYPGAQVVRSRFPGYINDDLRYSLLMEAS